MPKVTLRERKYARTKLGLLQAAAQRLEQQPWEAISVRDLCQAAEVSEATFFNYFTRKDELLDYYIQLWTLELACRVRLSGVTGLAAIQALFDLAARRCQDQPGLMGEVLAHLARQRDKPRPIEISRIERVLAFPGLDGIEEAPAAGLDAVLVPALQQAIERGELPPNSAMPTLLVGLVALFYGVPMTLRQSNPKAISGAYRQQLVVFWAGVRTAARGA